MYEFLILIGSWVLFVLPAYIANAVPVIFGGGVAVDFGKLHNDMQPIFGPSKTWKGLIAAIFFGTLAGIIIGELTNNVVFWTSVGLLQSSGTMFGDLLGSFIKRRARIPPSQPFLIADQLFFILFALLFAAPFQILPWQGIIFVVFLTLVLHVVLNLIAHKIGVKRVPW